MLAHFESLTFGLSCQILFYEWNHICARHYDRSASSFVTAHSVQDTKQNSSMRLCNKKKLSLCMPSRHEGGEWKYS
jgi:hypothetical protein